MKCANEKGFRAKIKTNRSDGAINVKSILLPPQNQKMERHLNNLIIMVGKIKLDEKDSVNSESFVKPCG